MVESAPQRIQRRRTKGWTMPEGAVYVGRPSKWGNCFTGPQAASSFAAWMRKEESWWPVPMPWPDGKIPAGELTTAADVRRELAGKDLACWCPLNKPCHADTLVEIANRVVSPPLSTPEGQEA